MSRLPVFTVALACALLLWALPAGAQDASQPMEVAITFDDLPAHGPRVPGQSELAVHQALLAVLRKHHIPATYGFINARKVDENPALRAVLEAWLAAGQELGNHTYSHADLSRLSVADFNADIDRNEPLLRDLVGPQTRRWKVFRYPYLREGATVESREQVRAHLQQRGYRIAEVTIDFHDWAWNPAYVRCLAQNDTRALTALQRAYLSEARQELQWSVRTAADLFGRTIAHVLLLHVGAFDAVMLDALLTDYENAGVHFISLDEAMQDPVYSNDSRQHGGGVLEQFISAWHMRHRPYVTQPVELLDALCR